MATSPGRWWQQQALPGLRKCQGLQHSERSALTMAWSMGDLQSPPSNMPPLYLQHSSATVLEERCGAEAQVKTADLMRSTHITTATEPRNVSRSLVSVLQHPVQAGEELKRRTSASA